MDSFGVGMSGFLKDLENWGLNHGVVKAICLNCKYEWRPYGDKAILLPRTEIIKCPSCCNRDKHVWLDSESAKRKTRKDLGLKEEDNNNSSDIARIQAALNESNKRIEQLEEKVKKLELIVKDLSKTNTSKKEDGTP